MHGLILVTWEKYLHERFGSSLLSLYRTTLGETAKNALLVDRVYDDAAFWAGIKAASQLTRMPTEVLLREYGQYFIVNGLTSHLCAYLLTQIHTSRDLLLVMNNAHTQMRQTPDGITPPLFTYETSLYQPYELVMIYDSPRQLCPLLWGAIEGAAMRYGEQVQIVEQTCMKQGAAACRFKIHFSPRAYEAGQPTSQQLERQNTQLQLANLVLAVLPEQDGITLAALQSLLQAHPAHTSVPSLRPSTVLEALSQLRHVGLVSSTAYQPGDNLSNRRYWRTPRS